MFIYLLVAVYSSAGVHFYHHSCTAYNIVIAGNPEYIRQVVNLAGG